MEGKIRTKDLHRLAYNGLLYANKTRACEGNTLWIRGGDRLRVVTTNDYFILVDEIRGLDHHRPETDKIMPLDFLKLLEKELRGHDGEFDLSDLQFTVNERMADMLWQADEYVHNISGRQFDGDRFTINPDDLRRLSLIKPQGYPLDFLTKRAEIGPGQYVADLHFKVGPDARGVISTLYRQELLKTYIKGEMF